MILSPWAIRNMMTLGESQFLAPKNSNLPGELVPHGFMAWEKTWLFRVRDCYLVPWRLNEEAIFVDDIPARAFDSSEEKERVAMILEQYNNDLTLTPEEDAAFGQLASDRSSHHPLRTYLWLPAARALTIWFTPRIELLPVSGHVFPLAQMREDDPVDQEVTVFCAECFLCGARDLGSCEALAFESSRSCCDRLPGAVHGAPHGVLDYAGNPRTTLCSGLFSGNDRPRRPGLHTPL